MKNEMTPEEIEAIDNRKTHFNLRTKVTLGQSMAYLFKPWLLEENHEKAFMQIIKAVLVKQIRLAHDHIFNRLSGALLVIGLTGFFITAKYLDVISATTFVYMILCYFVTLLAALRIQNLGRKLSSARMMYIDETLKHAYVQSVLIGMHLSKYDPEKLDEAASKVVFEVAKAQREYNDMLKKSYEELTVESK